ncbi:MAG TPA: hypothetical protein VK627_10000 [Edaphobacter sp.]|jgi:hypothetical protein|nr:hypothetical protein [Edaphobacter sp.]
MNRARRMSHAKPFHIAITCALLCTIFVTSGCTSPKAKPTPANFTLAINKYFLEHTDCLLPNTRFPFETTDKAKTKQMDSLVKALLLDKSEEMSIHASRYTATPTGARFAPKFCYGHREVTSIEGSSPLAPVNGFNQTTVTYHYEMKEVPVWAKTASVLAAFPEMAAATSGDATAKVTLAQTAVGWQVPD